VNQTVLENSGQFQERQQALSRWDTDGGATPTGPQEIIETYRSLIMRPEVASPNQEIRTGIERDKLNRNS
jgi:hypothetical protein